MNGSSSFGDFLRALKSSFPPALTGGSELERLFDMAGRLPVCAIDQRFGFEFDLANEKPGADFCVIARPGAALAAHYIREGESAPPDSPPALLGACLARASNDPASLLARNNGILILEYDVSNALSANPAWPGVFFAAGGNSAAEARRLFDNPGDVLAELRSVAGWRADANESRRIERVRRVLPEGAIVAQAGVLPGRAQRAVRLVIHRIDPAALPELLERLAWPGSIETVMSVIAHTSDLTQPLAVLSLDIAAGGLSPRLGVELFLDSNEASKEAERNRWLPVIDRLEAKQWCLPAKAEGLRAWAGTGRVIGKNAIFQAYRSLNHLKAVVLHGQVTAKAYAAVLAQPIGA